MDEQVTHQMRWKSTSVQIQRDVSNVLQPPMKKLSIESSHTVSSPASDIGGITSEKFKYLYNVAKECGSKSIKIDFSSMSMEISVD